MSCVLWWGVWCLPWNKSTLYPGCTQATQISTNGAQAGEQINKFKYFLFKFDYVRSIPTSARQTIGTFYFFISIFPYKLFRGGEPFFTGITQIRLFITKIIETKKHENALYYFGFDSPDWGKKCGDIPLMGETETQQVWHISESSNKEES